MKFLKRLFIFGLVLVALFLVVGLFLPTSAHVERAITTSASPQAVYDIVSGFRRFNEWSPWADLDPNTRYTYSGPDTGVGARMEWQSDDSSVGSGSQEVLAVEPGRSVTNKLDFGSQGQATATITLAPEGDGTRIVWAFDSSFEGNFLGRYFGLMFEKYIGADYEKGLARLKAVAEAGTPADAPPIAAEPVAPSPEDQPADTASSPAGQATPAPPDPQ
jgi:uncharacterized protein YndB with AHSA1/START domain